MANYKISNKQVPKVSQSRGEKCKKEEFCSDNSVNEESQQGDSKSLGYLKIQRGIQLQNNWKKQINLYLDGCRKNGSKKIIKKFLNDVPSLLNLLNGDLTNRQELFSLKQKNKSQWQGYDIQTYTFGRLSKSEKGKYIVLSHCLDKQHKFHMLFSMNVINSEGKIVYAAINIRSLQQVYSLFAKYQKIFKNSLLLIQEKDALQQLLNKKQEFFQNWLNSFEDLQAIKSALQSPAQPTKKQENLLIIDDNISKEQNKNKIFFNPLSYFIFIRRSLINNLLKKQIAYLSCKYNRLLVLAYNIILPIIQSTKLSYQHQVNAFLPKIEQIISLVSQEEQKQLKITQCPSHFPTNLTNAHSCWKCKCRNIIQCLKCTLAEGRTVSLCLACFGPYHQSIDHFVEDNQEKNIMSKWQEINLQNEQIIKKYYPQQNYVNLSNVKEEEVE